MEKENLILEFMAEENYVPMRAKDLACIFNVSKEKYPEFKSVLDKLESECKIQINRKSKYSLMDESKNKTGIFRANERGFGFVKVEGMQEEIFIAANKTNGALNGDKVLIEILTEGNGSQHSEGQIIKIIKHEKDVLVGIFQKSKNFGFVKPDDRSFGTDIFISKKYINDAKNNQKVVVKIVKYPENGKKAEGIIQEIIGDVNQAGVDMMSLIKEHSLPYEFPENVLQEARNTEEEISDKEKEKRLDLTKKEIFTIDGEDAKDLDDAIYVEKNDNGNYILGVHIADVSHYVTENSKLNQEAIVRGTSIYMLDRVIPMLPKELSNGICSLNAGKERLAISVIMEIDNNGNVVSSDIQKSVIEVTERMNYTDVQKIIDRSDTNVLKKYEKYINHFDLMKELALILKARRDKAGSLNLDIPESKIILDKNGIAIDIKKYEMKLSNEIIEQFMLTANETVAEKFYWLEAPFIYRVHEEPDMDRVEELNKFIFNFGYKIKVNGDSIYPKAFAQILDGIKGKPEEMVISNLVLRTLKVARYEAENRGHFGIASKYYCHFTSPIRRYPDLFIHRIISIYLDKNYELDEQTIEKYRVQAIEYADTSSEREKIAQKVERESIDIKMAEYMQDKIGNEYDGIISNITQFGIFVELDNTVEGLIRFNDLGNEYFIYDEERKHLIGEKTNVVYKVGDPIKIKVIAADKIMRRIDFAKVKSENL